MAVFVKSDVSADDNTLLMNGPDENLMKGTRFKANFADASYAWPLGSVIANAAQVANAASNQPQAFLAGLPSSSPAMTYVAGKGFQLNAPASANYERISLEAAGGVLDTNLTNNKIIWCWVIFPTTDPGTLTGGYIISKMTGFSNSTPGIAIYLTSYTAHTFGVKFGNGSAPDFTWPCPVMPTGSPHLFGLARMTYAGDPVIGDGTYIELYFDGICQVRQPTSTALTAISNDLSIGRPNLSATSVTSVPGMIALGGGVEDLTISARSAQQMIAAEYEMYAGTW